MWPNVEEVVEITLSRRRRMLQEKYPGFGYAPDAHKRICDKIYAAKLQIVREDQIVDAIQAAVVWEERVMSRAHSEAEAWNLRDA